MIFRVVPDFLERVDPEERNLRLAKVRSAQKRYYGQVGQIGREWQAAVDKKIRSGGMGHDTKKVFKTYDPQSRIAAHRLRKAHLIVKRKDPRSSSSDKSAASKELTKLRVLRKHGKYVEEVDPEERKLRLRKVRGAMKRAERHASAAWREAPSSKPGPWGGTEILSKNTPEYRHHTDRSIRAWYLLQKHTHKSPGARYGAAQTLKTWRKRKAAKRAGEKTSNPFMPLKPKPKYRPGSPFPEAKRPFEKRLKRVASWTKRRQGLKQFDVHHDKRNDTISLDQITVPKSKRSQGAGSRAMSMLGKFADRHKKTTYLQTADKNKQTGTTSKTRLRKFYKRHGYVQNKGRNKDYSLSMYASMYRRPKTEAKWIQKAIKKPGALHRQLGVPQGQKIPAATLAAAAGKGGKLGRRARLAQTLKKL